MSFLNQNIKAARKASGMTQEEMAAKLLVPLSTYATWEKEGTPNPEMISKVAKVHGYKYADLIDEDFITNNELQDPPVNYKRKRKSLIKEVDSESLLTHDTLQIKAMLRVMLRSQAAILAAQQDVSVKSVLAGMTKDVRDETSDEFDEL